MAPSPPRPPPSQEDQQGAGALGHWVPRKHSGLLALWGVVLSKPRPCFSCTSGGPGPGAEAGFEGPQAVGVTCSSQNLAEFTVYASGSRLRIPLFRVEFWAAALKFSDSGLISTPFCEPVL